MLRKYIFAISITCAHRVSPNSILTIAHAMVSLLFAQRFCNLMKSSWLALIEMCNKKTVAQDGPSGGWKTSDMPRIRREGFWRSKSSRAAPFVILQFSCNIWHDVVYFYGRSPWLFNHSLLTRLAGFGHTMRRETPSLQTGGLWCSKARAKQSHSAGCASEQIRSITETKSFGTCLHWCQPMHDQSDSTTISIYK